MDWTSLDVDPVDPHMLTLAMSAATKGDNDAARRVLAVHARTAPWRPLHDDLWQYVDDIVRGLAQIEAPSKLDFLAAFRLSRPRGKPSKYETQELHLKAATGIRRRRVKGETFEIAAEAVAACLGKGETLVRESYSKFSEKALDAAICMECPHWTDRTVEGEARCCQLRARERT